MISWRETKECLKDLGNKAIALAYMHGKRKKKKSECTRGAILTFGILVIFRKRVHKVPVLYHLWVQIQITGCSYSFIYKLGTILLLVLLVQSTPGWKLRSTSFSSILLKNMLTPAIFFLHLAQFGA